MADFLANLWGSVFTPGPTPTLLVATNVTFACLQVTLFALLLGTYSIHFVILSMLCAGLWVSINWFARELQAAQAQAAAEEKKDAQGGIDKRQQGAETDDELGTGTETEIDGKKVRRSLRVRSQRSATPLVGKSSATEEAEARRRATRDAGDISTDSEWEKVESER